ncbi:MAG: hypothetical protein HZA51_09110 [Planctomycetes bacterium]|nr:hypothetical protein [Planctomycetota bacterium]
MVELWIRSIFHKVNRHAQSADRTVNGAQVKGPVWKSLYTFQSGDGFWNLVLDEPNLSSFDEFKQSLESALEI